MTRIKTFKQVYVIEPVTAGVKHAALSQNLCSYTTSEGRLFPKLLKNCVLKFHKKWFILQKSSNISNKKKLQYKYEEIMNLILVVV